MESPGPLLTFLGFMFSSILLPSFSPAITVQCDIAPVSVTAESITDVENVCSQVMQVRSFMSNCGLEQQRTLNLEIVRKLLNSHDSLMIAKFDKSVWKIQVLDFRRLASTIMPRSAYHRLRLKDVYDSLIDHEIAHAIFIENASHVRLPATAHEYVAYAVQISLMTSETRAMFLSAFPQRTPRDLSMFNSTYLAMAPLAYGAGAYQHFTKVGQGCEMLRNIIAGNVTFPIESEGFLPF